MTDMKSVIQDDIVKSVIPLSLKTALAQNVRAFLSYRCKRSALCRAVVGHEDFGERWLFSSSRHGCNPYPIVADLIFPTDLETGFPIGFFPKAPPHT